MAYTLSNLRDDIRNYTEVSSTVLTDAILDTMIKNAENRIYRSADNDDNRFYATSTLTTGNRYVTIPSDLRIIRYAQLKDPSLMKKGEEFKILVTANKKNNVLEISDNGIGMSKDELIESLGTIAKSGTEDFIKKMEKENNKDIEQIGKFGVGFYSGFMVATIKPE